MGRDQRRLGKTHARKSSLTLVNIQVQIMAGKDKGQQGKVAVVMRKNQEVIVEGLNCV